MRFGAVDVGTNSVHLIVVEIDPYVGSTRTVLKAREMIRLGAGDALARERLSKKAITRGIDAIAQFVEEAHRCGALEVRIAATSAVRDAKNRDEFLSGVLQRTGIPVEVLSGREEARLIHLGVSRGYPFDERLACIVDIGGGSTEFIVADQYRTYFLKSLALGSLRLYEQFRREEILDTVALQAHLQIVFEQLMTEMKGSQGTGEMPIETLIGTSGTWLGLAALDAGARGEPFNRSHGAVIRLERLELLQTRMLAMNIDERRRMPGMSARRSDIIVAGNEVAMAVMRAFGIEEVVVCDRALREGIVADFLQRNHDRIQAVGDLRLRRLDSVRDVARRFDVDMMHALHVSLLSAELYDSCVTGEPWNEADRDLLVAAALVHDIGQAVHRSAHHKHSAYLVRHANLLGWRPREREFLAQIVRYHRKGLPKPAHPEFMALDPIGRNRVERLAALLRIAEGLDCRHLGRVLSCAFLPIVGGIQIELRAEGEIYAEIQAAQAKADLFSRVFGAVPEFRIVNPVAERADGEALGAV